MSCEAVNSFLFNTERLTNIVIRYEEFSVLKTRANTAKLYLVPFAEIFHVCKPLWDDVIRTKIRKK